MKTIKSFAIAAVVDKFVIQTDYLSSTQNALWDLQSAVIHPQDPVCSCMFAQLWPASEAVNQVNACWNIQSLSGIRKSFTKPLSNINHVKSRGPLTLLGMLRSSCNAQPYPHGNFFDESFCNLLRQKGRDCLKDTLSKECAWVAAGRVSNLPQILAM